MIYLDEKYRWHSEKILDYEIFLIGSFWSGDKYYSSQKGCMILAELFNEKNYQKTIENKLKNITGHFSFIIKNSNYILAFVDKVRSYPIFYSVLNNKLYISNSAVKLQANLTLYEKDSEALTEFSLAGYTLGSKTLFKNLYQVQAGEYILYLIASCELIKAHYYLYFKEKKESSEKEELIDKLHLNTMETFKKLIESLNGRPVFIPLSGGYDSRLILALLHELKYDNITTYTYGLPGVWEIKRAKYIAEVLKVKWHYVEFRPKQTREIFRDEDRIHYYSFASGLNSIPHLAEYYSLLLLRKKRLIPDNAIIINGQSGDFTSGGHIPKLLLNQNEEQINIERFVNIIIEKHFSLWKNLKSDENINIVSNNILNLLKLPFDKKLSRNDFAKYFELHEWSERQSKYVVNGQRAYDWLGYEWALPLWSDELMKFWMNVDWQLKISQKLLMEYLSRYNFGRVFNIELPIRYSYYPFYSKPLLLLMKYASKRLHHEADYFVNKYLMYYMTYAPVYPQKKYTEFLKDSKYHRSPVSYWVKYYLSEVEKVSITNENTIFGKYIL